MGGHYRRQRFLRSHQRIPQCAAWRRLPRHPADPRYLPDVQRAEPPAHGVCGGSVRYPRSPAGGAGALTPRPRALDMAFHIDLSNPHAEVWNFLRPFVEQFDAAIFSSPAFTRQLPIPQYLFYPCIDPLSEKNKDLEPDYVQKVCDDFGVDRSRPVLTQISRFDRLKDPVGVIEAYKLAKKYVDCQLVLAGGGATDDPEGASVLAEVIAAAGDDPA